MTLFEQDSDYCSEDGISTSIEDSFVVINRPTEATYTSTFHQNMDQGMEISMARPVPSTQSDEGCGLMSLDGIEISALLPDDEAIDVQELCEQFGDSLDISLGQESGKGQDSVNGAAAKDIPTPAFEVEFDYEKIYSQDREGDTLLHSAIILLEMDTVFFFLRKARSYLDICLKNLYSQAPIHLATLTKQTRIVRALMTAGADVTSRDREGNTALYYACREGSLDIVRTLLEPLQYTELSNTYDIPNVEIPQDMNVTNYEGLAPLHIAAKNQHYDVIDFLESKGANLNVKEKKTGRTILHNACIDSDLNLVRKLLKYRKCNINARAYDGHTPFDLARYKKDESICMLLAAAGARYGDDEMDSD